VSDVIVAEDTTARALPDTAVLTSQIVSIAEAKKSFSELCSRASYGRDTIVVTKHGRPFVAIIGMAELARAMALEDQRAVEILERAIATSPGTTRVELHSEG
jgi:prevent-host-death family protein